MYKLGTMIITAPLFMTAAHAEETSPQQSVLPATELTPASNAAAQTSSQEHAAQAEVNLPQSEMNEPPVTNPAAEIQTGFNPGTVARAVFTTAIAEREPVDTLESIEAQDQKIYYFTELLDMQGQTATHRWEYNGEAMAEVAFEVQGPRWRVWSSKNLQPAWQGEWKVSVLNSANEVINETTLQVVAPTEQTEPPATPAVTTQ